MKKILMTAGALTGLSACAPAATTSTSANDGSGFSYEFFSPQTVRIWIRGIGQFPNPKDVFFAFDCTTGKPDNTELVDSLSKQYPGLIQGSYVVYKDFVVGCNDGHSYARSSTLKRTTEASLGGMFRGRPNGDIEVLTGDGYTYPNLKLDPYSFHTTLQIKSGVITAFDGSNGIKDSHQTSIVGLLQGRDVAELKNGNRSVAQFFDAKQPATVLYKLSGNMLYWNSLTFNYSTGEIWAAEPRQ